MKTTAIGSFLVLVALGPAAAAQTLLVDDSLRGSTSGTRGGGSFSGDGWRVTGKSDFILWHVPTLRQGAIEFAVRGMRAGRAPRGRRGARRRRRP